MQIYRKAMSRLAVRALLDRISDEEYEQACSYNWDAAEKIFEAVKTGGYVAHYWLYGRKVHGIISCSTREAGAEQLSFFDSLGAMSHSTITSVEEMDRELPDGVLINLRKL